MNKLNMTMAARLQTPFALQRLCLGLDDTSKTLKNFDIVKR